MPNILPSEFVDLLPCNSYLWFSYNYSFGFFWLYFRVAKLGGIQFGSNHVHFVMVFGDFLFFLHQLWHHFFMGSSEQSYVGLFKQINKVAFLSLKNSGDQFVNGNWVHLQISALCYNRVVADVLVRRVQLIPTSLYSYFAQPIPHHFFLLLCVFYLIFLLFLLFLLYLCSAVDVCVVVEDSVDGFAVHDK